jgi:hypothetical protein
MVRVCSLYQKAEVHTGFGGNTRGEEMLGKVRHRWGNNIKIDLPESD